MLKRRGHVNLEGAVGVVTGAGSGIGRSLALGLARGGAAQVYVTDIDSERVAAVTAELRAIGTSATPVTLDVADPDAVGALALQVYESHDRVDVLCNNAGVGHAGAVADCELADWRRIVEINIMGVVHGVHHFVPRMITQGGAPSHIINTASMAGLIPSANMAPYSTSKYGIVGMSECLALELREHNIGVTALCPGIINTDIVRTSVVRGEFGKRHDNLVKMYAKSTSPDVVAADALKAATHGRIIEPSPSYQVTPAWLLKRYVPPASRGLSRLIMRFAGTR